MAATAVAAARDGGDLLSASSVGTRLICRRLGVPDGDDAVFTKWAEALSPVLGVMTPEQIADATTAITEMQGTDRPAQDDDSGRVDGVSVHRRGLS